MLLYGKSQVMIATDRIWVFTVALVCVCFSPCPAQTVLIEAEGFENIGGWVIDQQFADQMGSPFLLAHGLGEPVADANKAARCLKQIK